MDTSGAGSGFSIYVQPDDQSVDSLTPLPTQFALLQNKPNPFNPGTRISFDLPLDAHVVIEIFDARGRHVRRLLDAGRPAGRASVVWDGRNDEGRDVGTGIYVYRIVAGDFTASRKMTLLR